MLCRHMLLILVAVVCRAPAVADAPSRPEKPNVLFLMADDLNTALSGFGHPQCRTPHLDRLAERGVKFENMHCQYPVCGASRASLMAGLYPYTTLTLGNEGTLRGSMPDVVTLSQTFHKHGYHAVRIGKIYHMRIPFEVIDGTAESDDPQSWNETFNMRAPEQNAAGVSTNWSPKDKGSQSFTGVVATGGDSLHADGMAADRAIRVLRDVKDRPFFLAVGFFRPHTPYVAPKKYFDLYPIEQMRLPYAPPGDRDDVPVAAFAHNCPIPHYNLEEPVLLGATQAYYACVSFIDAQVGRLLAALERLDLTDNTIVVFWSDHGYHLGEHHGVWQKRTLFEQGARAPLIIRAPGQSGNGTASPRVVEFLDIYPTLTSLAEIDAPVQLAGKDLCPLLANPIADWDGYAITQVLRPADDRLKQPVMGCSIRTERWRYNEWAEGRAGLELYDHQTDPMEFHNLAIDPDRSAQAVIDRLRPILRKHASGETPTTPFNPARL